MSDFSVLAHLRLAQLDDELQAKWRSENCWAMLWLAVRELFWPLVLLTIVGSAVYELVIQ